MVREIRKVKVFAWRLEEWRLEDRFLDEVSVSMSGHWTLFESQPWKTVT